MTTKKQPRKQAKHPSDPGGRGRIWRQFGLVTRLLCTGYPKTMEELTIRLGGTERTTYRVIRELEEVGIKVRRGTRFTSETSGALSSISTSVTYFIKKSDLIDWLSKPPEEE